MRVARVGSTSLNLLAFLTIALLGAPRSAEALCEGCDFGNHECRRAAAHEFRGCAMECRAMHGTDPSSLLGCLEACRDGFAAAREACTLDGQDCGAICLNPPDEVCARGCTDSLRGCLSTARDGRRSCTTGCRDMLGDDILACLLGGARDGRLASDPGARIECLRTLIAGLGACFQGCAEMARDDVGLCVDGLRQCVTGCGSP